MIKKIIAVMVALALLFSVAACGGSSKSSDDSTTKTSTGSTSGGDSTTGENTAPKDIIEYTFLNCWNGGGGDFPDGFENSELVQKLTEITGVKLKVEVITSSEREKLATVFASGDLPDITNAPHWSTNPGGEGELIKNAAVEGLLLPLKNLIQKYPNIMRLYEIGAISQVYKERDIEHPDYNGEIYVIPTQTGRTKEDVTNWAYNLFARSDILEALNIKPEEVTTTEAIYDLLVKIKNGNFTDINGKPVIPGGTWHNGWSYGEFQRGFQTGNVTGWVMQDGKLINGIFTQNEIDKALFMRKLVAEGLFDPECFTQTDTMAKEKMITGRVAVFGCHYPNQYGFFKGTLYQTNPEMKYVPLGPILNQKGEAPAQIERVGRTGSPVLFFSKNIKDPDRALAFVDYINSDEGLELVTFGIEGKHYTKENGVPKYTEEWKNIKNTDSNKFKLEGFGLGGSFIGADPRKGWGWEEDYMEEGYVKAREINPLKFIDYKTADDVVNTWPGKAAYDEKMSTTNWGDELKKAYLAKSDEEAIAIIEAQRKRMIDAGYLEMEKFLNEEYAKDPKIIY
ncbi:extracellular solute-binding protein [Pseudoclostridium thermosuccinogenes]|uniref:extracellular solute-binding protein n=1 Tax=Clostridium thermosuccinogenes TaxID=84032 RepID=UPI000CCC9F1E|nr:extracellular solute-binding protein [Pseudoclostridium thermosuccinogenes]PNT93540.1 hypothetical protein CDQ83_08580 [Pseudoclostridium thermosuccinogenes]